MPWFDIGINLTDRRYANKHELLAQAQQHDVGGLICIGTDIEGSQQSILLANQLPNVYATAGVHPHYAKDVEGDYLQKLKDLAADPKVIAMGECGLDFNRNFSPPAEQLQVFEQQLVLASELQLPVFLHERDAFEQQIQLLKKYRSELVGGVVHCFTGNERQIQAYLELDLYIGVTGWLCDPKRAGDLRHALKYLPLDRLLLETDGPYLIPKNVRGQKTTIQCIYLL